MNRLLCGVFASFLLTVTAGCSAVDLISRTDEYNQSERLQSLVFKYVPTDLTSPTEGVQCDEKQKAKIAQLVTKVINAVDNGRYEDVYSHASLYLKLLIWDNLMKASGNPTTVFLRHYPTVGDVDLKDLETWLQFISKQGIRGLTPTEAVEIAMIRKSPEVDQLCLAGFLFLFPDRIDKSLPALRKWDGSCSIQKNNRGLSTVEVCDLVFVVDADGEPWLYH